MSDPLAAREDGMLPGAIRIGDSRGRAHQEPEHAFRNPFQRDRDRILHSSSFRRLEYKTQVFVNGEGDHYRTRLTHTLEVSQISRTIARELRLNEDFTEAVALSHDLGHTPFGHAGEKVLDDLLVDDDGFDHNSQGLRVVDLLEKRYSSFNGLNLTFETREAFFRHGGRESAATGEFSPDEAPLLEVAATILADDIAYLAHDLDDGLYSGILKEENLRDVTLWRLVGPDAVQDFTVLPVALRRVEGVRRLINLLVTDAITATRDNLRGFSIDSVDKVRSEKNRVVAFSKKIGELKKELKHFLFVNLYRHPNVMTVMVDRQDKLKKLFLAYVEKPEKMPEEYGRIADRWGIKRAAADYVAGMTDRFATDEANRM